MKVEQLLVRNYSKIFSLIQLLSPYDTKIFNKTYISKYKPHEYSFQGYFQCGPSCFIIKQLLDFNNISNKVYKSNHFQYIHNEYISDHCYIIIDNNIIIDPTIRQFLVNPDISLENNLYYDYIFLYNSPFFVDNKIHLEKHLEICNSIYYDTYNNDIFNVTNTLNFWNEDSDITSRFKLDEFIKKEKTHINYDKIIKNILKI